MKTLRLVALSFAAVGLFAGSLFAEDAKSDKPVDPKAAIAGVKVPPPPANAKDVPAATIDQSEKLEAMLKEMGINFEKKTDEKAGVVFFAVREYGPDNFYFEVEESKNKKYIWISFPCGKVPETGIPSEIMEKLLQENTRLGTASFQVFPTSKMIYLKKSLANASLDAKSLKQDINWLVKDASRTRNLWDFTLWTKSTTQK